MKNLTPNRVAALSGAATALLAGLVTLLGAVDSIAKAIVVAVALIVVGAIVAVFLLGGQRWEELVFRRDNDTADQTVEVKSTPPAERLDAKRVAEDLGLTRKASASIADPTQHPTDVGGQEALAVSDGDPLGFDPDGGVIDEGESAPDTEIV